MCTVDRRRFLALAGSGVAAAATAIACGDGDEEAPSSPTSAGGGAAAPASPTARVEATAEPGTSALRWFGQAMFLLTSPGGTRILLDPFNNIGYPIPPAAETTAAAATISHEHPDHNNGSLVGAGEILKGLSADGWVTIDKRYGDVRVFTVQSFHDAANGAQRGRNAIFVYESGGMRLVHLGDLGHKLTADQVRAIGGSADVVMVPVGGSFTIGAAEATEVIAQLSPKLVFPMHYKTPAISLPLASVDEFLVGKTVQRVGSTNIRLAKASLPAQMTVAVLDYA
jgi:L-ascorbate metabolism protein UlaG (beta-lactamase superfamily)